MSVQKVEEYLKQFHIEHKIQILEQSSATVELAAEAVGCEPARIAKTLSFFVGPQPILIVTAGDVKVDNKKYKQEFGTKAKMISFRDVEKIIGHAPGGVCPFAVNRGIKVYLDQSLQRFQTVYPAAGSGNSAIEMNLKELKECSKAEKWIDVCKKAE
ncbi:MAG TPA: YbaK/EbsC family protein [Candidatus Anaerostipes excrementavium]|uniref:YbaK/EbsC family protein n=1 Tax=Candidatus Anaerostipes excrementavium TaxID=2838463 RepID=A0A9D1WVX1_9FIRM|nr:YbaK/EbsC family protein [uncultured Anaerostipes sp.]HIX67785.1 YbaK/EbsC family protein [Candidatus Anaerostipes excrementavium]